MSNIKLSINTFLLGTSKDAAKKLPEEAAEAFAEFIILEETEQQDTTRLADEIADVIQAACNLAARYDIDIDSAMKRCTERNLARGRYAD